MAGNSFGQIFRITSFGESHGKAIGGIIDGCPAGLTVNMDFIRHEMQRRKPGHGIATSKRDEADEVEFLSGIFEGKTTGTPISFQIKNKDQRSKDYSHIKDIYRPSHADFTYDQKYGFRDYRGGGRASARETAVRVVAGAIAKMLLQQLNINITAFVSQLGEVALYTHYTDLDLSTIEDSNVRCPDAITSEAMEFMLNEVVKLGDTIGGIITCVVKNVPAGWGEPVYDKIEAQLAKAMLSINATKGFDIGLGFKAAQIKGSESNDPLVSDDKGIHTSSNNSGGVQGGISNGEDIFFRVAFKSVSTLQQSQKSVTTKGDSVEFEGKGRHDASVVPRAVPIVEAMAALVLADMYLLNRAAKV